MARRRFINTSTPGPGAFARPHEFVQLRLDLIEEVWGRRLPKARPTVSLNYTGLSYASSFPLEVSRVDRLLIDMPRGGVSEAHLLYPVGGALNRCAILHAGHSIHYYDAVGSTNMEALTRAFLAAKWHVLGMCMPTDTFNATQSFAKLDGTPVTVSNHDFTTLESDGAHPFRFFVEPVIVSLNHLATLGFDRIVMSGISGGGWTTDFAAALDPRIIRSYPVFGSVPFALRTPSGGPGDEGDWEQLRARSWWDTVVSQRRDHERVYGAGCIDDGRKRVQFLGTGDPVFGVSTVLPAVSSYETWINERVPAGQHDVSIDVTASTHAYSAPTIAAIVVDANEGLSDPLDDVTGKAFWYRADDGVLVAGAVSTWTDQTGQRNVTQGTSGNRPTFVAATPPYVSFDNVNDFLQGSMTIAPGSSFTLFLVSRAHDTSSDHGIFDTATAGEVTNTSMMVLHTSGAITARVGGDNAATFNETGTDIQVHCFTFTTALRTIQKEGGTTTQNAVADALVATDRFRLGMLFSNVLPAHRDMFEVIGWDRELTADEKATAFASLMARWGV